MGYLRFAAVAMAVAFSGCASLPFAIQTPSRLPIQVRDQASGEIQNVRAYEQGERLIVSGRVWTIHVKGPTHVDICLISSGGSILAQRQEDIERGRSTTAHNCRHTFIASFPIAEVKRAARVQVTYHDGLHR